MKTFHEYLFEQETGYSIYCDLDGVLCDFDNQFLKFNQGSMDDVEKKYGPEYAWNMILKAGKNWWSSMAWMADGKKLWKAIEKFNPIILTAGPKTGEKAATIGKKEWVHREIGYIPILICPSKDKWQYANKSSILIDDRSRNIKQWVKAGGIGIKHKNVQDTIKKLQEILGREINEQVENIKVNPLEEFNKSDSFKFTKYEKDAISEIVENLPFDNFQGIYYSDDNILQIQGTLEYEAFYSSNPDYWKSEPIEYDVIIEKGMNKSLLYYNLSGDVNTNVEIHELPFSNEIEPDIQKVGSTYYLTYYCNNRKACLDKLLELLKEVELTK